MTIENLKRSAVRLWRDEIGQDLIEYVLLTAFVAAAAGAIMPGVASSIRTIFVKIVTVMSETDPVVVSAGVAPSAYDDFSIIRIVCAVLAICLLGILILRRKKSEED